jgi:hypothetical protein
MMKVLDRGINFGIRKLPISKDFSLKNIKRFSKTTFLRFYIIAYLFGPRDETYWYIFNPYLSII